MRKRLLILISVSILAFLFLTSVVHAETIDIEMSFIGGKSLFAKNERPFYGAGSRLFFRGRSYYIDIWGILTKVKGQLDIEDFDKIRYGFEIEKSLKWLAINFTHNVCIEKARLFPFNQPKDTIMTEKWDRKELTAGLGLKWGSYDKSFIRIVGIAGVSFYQNTADLKFLDMALTDDREEMIVGINIKSRYEDRLKSQGWKKVYVTPVWIDFQGGYNYYLKSKEYKAESTIGLGVEVIKHLGVKGSVTVMKRINRRLELVRYCAGLVLIF